MTFTLYRVKVSARARGHARVRVKKIPKLLDKLPLMWYIIYRKEG